MFHPPSRDTRRAFPLQDCMSKLRVQRQVGVVLLEGRQLRDELQLVRPGGAGEKPPALPLGGSDERRAKGYPMVSQPWKATVRSGHEPTGYVQVDFPCLAVLYAVVHSIHDGMDRGVIVPGSTASCCTMVTRTILFAKTSSTVVLLSR